MYLPETPPLPPIKPGDPDYDPFAKPRRRSCSYRSPAPVSGSAQRVAPSWGRSADDTKRPARPVGRK
nr:MAG TPA: hypothetical protein [Caudoviricetes sp.]